MVVVKGGGNVLQNVNGRGNCPGGGMSGGNMSGECPDPTSLTNIRAV